MNILKKIIPNRYTIIILILLVCLYFTSSYMFNFESSYKWWYGLIMYCIAEYVGNVIHSTKYGFNIKHLYYIGERTGNKEILTFEDSKQSFTIEIITDFRGSSVIIAGNFNNEQYLSPDQLKSLLFNKVNIKKLLSTLNNNEIFVISFTYGTGIIYVEFERMISNLKHGRLK